ncbi:MAG TPA: hypothetical protein VFM88_18030, partial [Vicinamibacteria bacterium]|nr:hypothetical protein [Vicinamibacteria bacterium]
MTERRAVLGLALGLSLLATHHMREALFEGRVYFERDLHIQWYGQMESFVHAVAQGALPLWDPWVGFGQPMLANPNNQILYPPTWLNLLMVPASYYKLYLFVHLVGGGLGASLLALRLGISRPAAFLAGAGFLLCGPFLSLANAWNHVAGAGLVPWLALCFDRLIEEPGTRRALVLGLVPALMVLAGSPDYLLLGGPAVLALGLWRLRSRRAPVRPVLLATTGAALFAIGLSAAQWVPSLELARRTARANLSAGDQDFWSLHPIALAQAAVPVDLAAAPVPPAWEDVLFEGREPYLFSVYMGVPLLLLAALGMAARGAFPRGALTLMTLLLGLVSLGRHAPLHALLVATVPPLGAVRFPVKAMTVAALLLALAAGRGIDVLKSTGAEGARRALAAAAFALAALFAVARWGVDPSFVFLEPPLGHAATLGTVVALLLLAPRAARVTLPALGALAIGDLALTHRSLNPTAPPDFYAGRPALIAAADPGDWGRWLVLDYNTRPEWSLRHLGRPKAFMVPSSLPPQYWRAAMAVRLYPIAPLLASWRVFGSYSRDLLGLLPPPLVRMNDALYDLLPGPPFDLLLRVGAVSHFAALHDVDAKSLRLERHIRGPFFEDIRLYRVEGSLPRAYVASEARGGTLLDAGFDPARQVLLEGEPPRRPVSAEPGPARILDYR